MSENTKVFVCHGKSCSEKFSKYILSRLEADKQFYDYQNCSIESSHCMGKCEISPNVKMDWEIFSSQNPVKSSQILHEKMMKNEK